MDSWADGRLRQALIVGTAVAASTLFLPVRAISELFVTYGEWPESRLSAVFLLIKGLSVPLAVVAALRLAFVNSGGRLAIDADVGRRLLVPLLMLAIALVTVGIAPDLVAPDGRSLRQFNLGVLQTWAYCLALGILLPDVLRLPQLVLLGWAVMVVAAFRFFDPVRLALDVSSLDPERVAVYLLYGDVFVAVTCLAVAVQRRAWLRFGVAFLGLLVAFVLYSRTSFFALVATYAINALRHSKRWTVVVVGLVAVVALVGVPGPELYGHRMLSFLEGPDESLSIRGDQIASGLESLRRNWLFGDYGGQVRELGEIGAYMHNALSYWRQFGLVFFMLYLLAAVRMVREWFSARSARSEPDFVLALSLLVPLVLVESIVARSYTYAMVWMALGASVNRLAPAPVTRSAS